MENLKKAISKTIKKANSTRNVLNRIEGITLIALIITVIIMLILAGIAISTIAGEEGLFTRASRVAKEYENASKREAEILDEMLNNEYMNTNVTDEEPGILAGTGAKDDPYLIESIEDLVAFSQAVAGGNKYEGQTVKMTVNLDFNSDNSYVNPLTEEYGDINGINGNEALKVELTTGSGFKPIGVNADYSFNGEFDGENHILRNIYLNKKDEEVAGLFGYVKDGSISNIRVTGNIATNGVANVGGIVANAEGIKIEGVNNEINITSESETDIKVGGIIGSDIAGSSKTEITNSSNSGTITVTTNETVNETIVGGIQGKTVDTVKVSNCNNNGKISNKVNGQISYTGGIIGLNSSDTIEINNCYNTVDISAETNNGNSNTTVDLGGILGANNSKGYMNIKENCYNTGKIYSESAHAFLINIGGAVGENFGNIFSISNFNNSGELYSNVETSAETIAIGGILGRNKGATSMYISNCYNSSKISINSSNGTSTWGVAGGIIGRSTANSVVLNCYNEGEIITDVQETCIIDGGGIIGRAGDVKEKINIINCYNVGNIISTNGSLSSSVGGIIGIASNPKDSVNVINCYNIGNMTSPYSSNGIAKLSDTGTFNVNNVYNTGTIEGKQKYNIGYITDSSCQVSNAYYKDDGTPASNVDTINDDETKVKAMSDDDMKNEQFAKELNDNASNIDLSELNDENLTGYNLRRWIVKDNSYPTFE